MTTHGSPVSDAMDRMDELALDPAADVKAVVSGAASALGLHVGVESPSTGRLVVAPAGSTAIDEVTEIARRHVEPDVTVWLAAGLEPATVHPADLDRIVARLATVVLVAESRWEHRGASADVRLLVSPDASEPERASALRRLGLGSTGSITVLAFYGESTAVEDVVAQIRLSGSGAHHAFLDRVHIVLASSFSAVEELVYPVGLRCGYAPPSSATGLANAWRHSVNALRFAIPSQRTGPLPSVGPSVAVPSSGLGVYEILAEQLTARELASNSDVARLEELCKQAGADILPTLLAVASHDSLRKAARVVHLHHNSVGHRVERAEKVLGFSCTEPFGRSRLLLTLTLHRLLASHALF